MSKTIKQIQWGALDDKYAEGRCSPLPEFKRNVIVSTRNESLEERHVFITERNRFYMSIEMHDRSVGVDTSPYKHNTTHLCIQNKRMHTFFLDKHCMIRGLTEGFVQSLSVSTTQPS